VTSYVTSALSTKHSYFRDKVDSAGLCSAHLASDSEAKHCWQLQGRWYSGDVTVTLGQGLRSKKGGMNEPVSYKRHRFPPEVIAHTVWLYFRFPLSLRLVEEMLLERGIVVSYETVRRWAIKFGPE
jgi:hypothetical protein